MNNSSKLYLLSASFLLLSGFISLVFYSQTVTAQTKPLTYAEITTALTNIQNNRQGKSTTKAEAIALVIAEIKNRGIDETFSANIETNLRKLGATDELIEAIEQNSPNYEFYMKRAEKTVKNFDYTNNSIQIESALADYTKAIELNPKSDVAYYKRADLYFCKNLRWGINGCVTSKDGYYYRDWFLGIVNKDSNLALADYNKAIELNPQIADIYLWRGSLQDDLNLALSDFQKFSNLKPLSEDARHFISKSLSQLALKYFGKKEYDLAINSYNKSFEYIDDKHIEFKIKYTDEIVTRYINRGMVYLTKKEYDLAIADFDKAIKNHLEIFSRNIERGTESENYYPYIKRGLAYEGKKDYKSAIADFQKALQIATGNDEAKEALARVLKLANP
ncbi:MAG TPA: hypothetical protein PKY82_15285 [Pyrinomonadaceae bacterium]|nr:hypothetical protein [Pyrinomonadaceae bacterium]